MDIALYRAGLEAEGRLACGVCGATEPAETIDVHHVVPTVCGGGHGPDNLVVLCDRHHAVAHENWYRIPGLYEGPQDSRALVIELKKDEAVLQLLDAILSPGEPGLGH
jgi:hypothetical protein